MVRAKLGSGWRSTVETEIAMDGQAAPLSPPPRSAIGGFFDRVFSYISDTYASLVASGALRMILLTLASVVAALVLVLALLWLYRRAVAALRRRPAPRDLRIRSWKIASGEQARDAMVHALSYLRILGLMAIAGGALWALALVLKPSLAAQAQSLARGVLLALASLLAWLVGLRAVRAVGASILSAVASKENSIKPLKYRSFTILSAPILEQAIVISLKLVGWFSLILSLAILFALILSFFSFTWSWSQAILSVFSGVVKPILDAIVAYLPKLLFAIVILAIARLLLKLLKAFFAEIEAGRLGLARFEREWASTTYKIIRLFVAVLTAVMIFPYIPGSDSEAFRSVALFLGVLLSLGSSSFVGNIMAGVSLTYMSAFRIGDRVKIGDCVGDVVGKTLLVTRVLTIKNVVVTIPNSVVLSKEVENFSSRSPQAPLILHTSVTIGYEVPWREVHAALLGAAVGVEGILAEPAPFVLQVALDDYSVRYELNASTDDAQRMAVIYSDLHRSIQDSFAKAGIEIMTPSYHAMRDGSASTIPRREP
jgi:small-conductance mechanosensitive channel